MPFVTICPFLNFLHEQWKFHLWTVLIGELGDAWNYEVFMWFCLLCRKNTTDKYKNSRKVLKLNTTEAGITEHVLMFIEYLINRH